MKLSAPKLVTWWIAVALGGLGILGYSRTVTALGEHAFLLVTGGLVLLVLATLLRKL